MKNAFIILMFVGLVGCGHRDNDYPPETPPEMRDISCSFIDVHYDYTLFECETIFRGVAFCDPYGEIERPGCIDISLWDRVFDKTCEVTNFCF